MLWTSLVLACVQQTKESSSCKGDYLFPLDQEVILSGQVQDYFDRDCDQIPLIDDCDDNDPHALSKSYDTDCDGVFDRKIIAAGAMHNCAIYPNKFGEISCWGSDFFEQTAAPSGVFLEISAGEVHTCALSVLNEIVCWGDNTYGQLDVPPGSYKNVFSGDLHSCGILENDSIQCWGAGQAQGLCAPESGNFDCGQSVPPNTKFQSLSLGRAHSCGIKMDGTISCWGDDAQEQADVPQGVYRQVAAHHLLNCALDADGKTTCWGTQAESIAKCEDSCLSAFDGECDDGILNAQFATCEQGTDCFDCGSRFIGENSSSDLPMQSISLGESNLCYTNSIGNLFCTNSLSAEQLGSNDFISPTEHSSVAFKTIDVGPFFNACGVTAQGTIKCWGASCWKQEDLSFNCMYGPLSPPTTSLWSSPPQ